MLATCRELQHQQHAGNYSTNYSMSQQLKVNTMIPQPEDLKKAKNYCAEKMPNPNK